jgi:hypothetical protein
MKLMRTIAALSAENSNPRKQKRASHPRQHQYDKNAHVNRRSKTVYRHPFNTTARRAVGDDVADGEEERRRSRWRICGKRV